MNIIKVPISKVNLWDKNPRNIKKEDLERLKRQILWAKDIIPATREEDFMKFQMLRPLIAYLEKGKYTVLGGNMRLRALREMGETKVEIKIVHPKTEADKIRIALIDNDRAGEYIEDDLAELVCPHIEEIDLADFKIDIGEGISLHDSIQEIGPNLIFGETATDRDGQGVSTTWEQVKKADSAYVMIGELEIRMSKVIINQLLKILNYQYNKNKIPIFVTFEKIITNGMNI